MSMSLPPFHMSVVAMKLTPNYRISSGTYGNLSEITKIDCPLNIRFQIHLQQLDPGFDTLH